MVVWLQWVVGATQTQDCCAFHNATQEKHTRAFFNFYFFSK